MYRIDFYSRYKQEDKEYHMSVFKDNLCVHYCLIKEFKSLNVDEYIKEFFHKDFEIFNIEFKEEVITVNVILK